MRLSDYGNFNLKDSVLGGPTDLQYHGRQRLCQPASDLCVWREWPGTVRGGRTASGRRGLGGNERDYTQSLRLRKDRHPGLGENSARIEKL